MDFSLILCGEKNFYRTVIPVNPALSPLRKVLTRVMRARPAFFVFNVHLFTISPQHAYDQRIAGEGFTFIAFTESSPISSTQPTH